MLPLDLAAKHGFSDQVKLLLQHDAEVNASNPDTGRTALHWALFAGHTDIIHQLIEGGASVLVGNAVRECVAVTKNLEHCGVVVQRIPTSVLVQTPIIHWAVQGGDSAVIDWAVKQFPGQLLAKDNLGNVPLHYATTSDVVEKLFGTLSPAAQQIESTNEKGDTALQTLVANPAVEETVIEKLLAHGAQLHNADLYVAARAGNVSMCSFLAKKGLKYDHSDDQDAHDPANAQCATLIKFADQSSDEVISPFPVVDAGTVGRLVAHLANRRYFDAGLSVFAPAFSFVLSAANSVQCLCAPLC
jgi:Ankyrin repeats (3 copies)